ncbi:MAG: hypothetical protein EXR73_04370 [Myxococcales bacterium]|nr:hypothetical protein [Myxococcales bacterium]
MRPAPLAAIAAAVAACALGPGFPNLAAAAPRGPAEQRHEVDADFQLTLLTGQDSATLIETRYVYSPQPLLRRDIVMPTLRRFVHRPDEYWLRAAHTGSTIDTRTGAGAGARVHALDRRIAFSAEVFAEFDDVRHDIYEDGYVALPVRFETALRVLPLLDVAVGYRARPVLASTALLDDARLDAERSGLEQEAHLSATFATNRDDFLGTVAVYARDADWTFTGFHSGELAVRGAGARLDLSLQISPQTSLFLRADGRIESWNNTRLGEAPDFVQDLTPTVHGLEADLGFLYWHKGELGIRVHLGGGYRGEEPVHNSRDRGLGRVGLGIVRRF